MPLSVLIILMGSLGDIARGLCLVSHLKSNLPGCRITWLVEPKWVELTTFHPGIDQRIVFHRAWRIAPVWKLFKELSQYHFDITLDLQRHFKSGFFSLLSGAKRRIGFHRRNSKEFNWLFNNERIGYFSDDLPKWRHYLKFTQHLGFADPPRPDFGFDALDGRIVAPGLFERIRSPFIAVVMGSSWESKDWESEGYQGLVKRILSWNTHQVVLLGDHSKEPDAARLSEAVGAKEVLNMVGKTSLIELVAVLKAAAAGVGPDSGPGHLASAVGTPYVSLFGPTAPRRVAPFGSEHLVVQSDLACIPCYKKRCPDGHGECMRGVTVEAVAKKLAHALETPKPTACKNS